MYADYNYDYGGCMQEFYICRHNWFSNMVWNLEVPVILEELTFIFDSDFLAVLTSIFPVRYFTCSLMCHNDLQEHLLKKYIEKCEHGVE